MKTQTKPGSPWPDVNNSNQSQQFIDYDVDSRIINDSRYTNSITAAFTSIPTVSVVSENDNLFNMDKSLTKRLKECESKVDI